MRRLEELRGSGFTQDEISNHSMGLVSVRAPGLALGTLVEVLASIFFAAPR